MSWLTRLSGRGRRRLLASAATALLLAAGGTLAAGISGQQHAPRPPASAALPSSNPPNLPPAATPARAPGPIGGPSAVPPLPAIRAVTPTAISIPAIGVHHALLSLGQNSDGTLQVPPLSDVSAPGWDRDSPVPGQVGPAVVVGHIDGTTGAEGVFYSLGALRPGDTVSITRSDGTVAVFRIDGVNVYAKDAFPTLTVYGNTTDPQLRLITCGGRFDHATQHYLDNTVAFATLTGIHRG
ncbi:class F sortase [Streptacidiphilus jiangxiensis]|uniref:Sortase family protein n=1 Tax=Streptacidiphilus jiangxiensis TaxID=235985 RepID=A0A1H7WBC8_STRJI|nr:class F sortase [Streptacidiphilus jiangxiensis]SEM18395.1 Sortase family protein [Streptacidiphilus jiangxiensis]